MGGPMLGEGRWFVSVYINFNQLTETRGCIDRDEGESTETRGREKFYQFCEDYPYIAHYWKYKRWSKEKERTVEEWQQLQSWPAYCKEVVKLRNSRGVE